MKLKATAKSIKHAASIIKKGGLVAFPTETVYGLGADALNPRAVAKIFEIKKRPAFDPLIVHIAEMEWLHKLTRQVDKKALILIKKFWPGPLTLVLLKSSLVPDIVTAGLDTVAVRMPAHPVARQLIKFSQTPIAAPSANLFGCLSPTTATHVEKQLGKKIDLILDAGKCSVGVESTVLSLVGGKPVLLRPGGLPVEEIEKAIGKVVRHVYWQASKSKNKKIQSPGQLPSHYSPRTPMKLIKSLEQIPFSNDTGVLLFKKPAIKIKVGVVEILSEKGDLTEAAANLFSALHRLDDAGVKIIYAERIPAVGLGSAIMDRLQRASFKE
ncbi:MAG: L-threonylcarbamoyladenylate synthase [Nanoarchaeota archaeon]